jgi:hypothetical protein
MSVIKHDFGLNKRRKTRRFTELLRLDALHEANIRDNPLPYLERASERIFQLEKVLFDAAQAADPSLGGPESSETVTVNRKEYQRLLNCRALLEHALKTLSIG